MTTLIGVDIRRTDTTPQFTLGQIHQDEDGKKYKYFLFNNGAGTVASVAGNFAYYYGVSAAGAAANVNTVTMDLTDAVLGAGVFQTIVPDGEYCWLQVTGLAVVTTALTAGADGNQLTHVGATDGTLDVTAAVTSPICAIAYDATARILQLICPE